MNQQIYVSQYMCENVVVPNEIYFNIVHLMYPKYGKKLIWARKINLKSKLTLI